MTTGLLVPDREWEAALADPFLRAHEIGVRMLEIGPRLSPLSIRDQMFRAAVAVDRAREHRLISKEAPILIVGGGAAGGAGAARALRHGINVYLVESNPGLFYRQSQCSTRWVSPTQYDWPAPHAAEHVYPSPSLAHKRSIELAWKADFGEGLARQWRSALRGWEIKPDAGKLRILTSTVFEGGLLHQTTRGVRIQAQIQPNPVQDSEFPYFSLVLLAMGLGDEKCTMDGHGGPAFWDEDSFDHEGLGLASKPRVLISGGGDGALQDYIRLVTGKKSALEVYENFEIPKSDRLELERAITWAEDHWQRSDVWSTKLWDCDLLRDLHRAYENEIEKLPKDFWGSLSERFKLRVPGEINLVMFHSCDHFGRGYALNHFVALALHKLLKLKSVDTIQGHRRIHRIEGDGCGGKTCTGRDHQVRSVSSDCDNRGGMDSELLDEGTFQVLVLRNGIESPSPLGNSGATPIRQMLPMFNPWPVKGLL